MGFQVSPNDYNWVGHWSLRASAASILHLARKRAVRHRSATACFLGALAGAQNKVQTRTHSSHGPEYGWADGNTGCFSSSFVAYSLGSSIDPRPGGRASSAGFLEWCGACRSCAPCGQASVLLLNLARTRRVPVCQVSPCIKFFRPPNFPCGPSGRWDVGPCGTFSSVGSCRLDRHHCRAQQATTRLIP